MRTFIWIRLKISHKLANVSKSLWIVFDIQLVRANKTLNQTMRLMISFLLIMINEFYGEKQTKKKYGPIKLQKWNNKQEKILKNC